MDSIIRTFKNAKRHYEDTRIITDTFKSRHSLEKRIEESTRIIGKYPDRVPVICERLTKKVPKIDRAKYLCPNDLTVGNFMYVIRKRLHISSDKALYLFINNTIVPVSHNLGLVYDQHKDKDGFLYINYDSESTFG